MQQQAVNPLMLLDKYVLKKPPAAIEVTFVGDAICVSFDNTHIPLRLEQANELHGYCGRAVEILIELSKRR